MILLMMSAVSMRTLLIEERMAGNYKRFIDATQAADYMLSLCERASQSGLMPDASAVAANHYLPQGPIAEGMSLGSGAFSVGAFTAGTQWWQDAAAWQTANGATLFDSNVQADVPQFEMNCLVESMDIPPDPTSHTLGDAPVFRVTAYAKRQGGTQVMLQSTRRY